MQPSPDPGLACGYGCGLVLVLALAIAFASVHGPLAAAVGFVIALPVFHLFHVIVKGFVFPLVEQVSRAVGKALGDD